MSKRYLVLAAVVAAAAVIGGQMYRARLEHAREEGAAAALEQSRERQQARELAAEQRWAAEQLQLQLELRASSEEELARWMVQAADAQARYDAADDATAHDLKLAR